MERLINALDETINKSTICDFNEFILKYNDVSKWTMHSDYCVGDKNKPNDVISFIIFPYIIEFSDWKEIVNSIQKKDLKHTRKIEDDFCKLLNEELFFGISFILDKKSVFDSFKDKEVIMPLLDNYVKLVEKWQDASNDKTYHKETLKKLNLIKEKSRKKNFNYKLLGEIFIVCFLASYLKMLLIKGNENIKLFSWVSDRDKITTWNGGIHNEIFHIISESLCIKKIENYQKRDVKTIYLSNDVEITFLDEMNRVADYICGSLADFDYSNCLVSAQKHCELIEKVISDNKFISIIQCNNQGFSRIIHNKIT